MPRVSESYKILDVYKTLEKEIERTGQAPELSLVKSAINKYYPDPSVYELNDKTKNKLRAFTRWATGKVTKTSLKEFLTLVSIAYHSLTPNHATLDSIMTTDVRKPISVRFGFGSKEHLLAKSLVRLNTEDKKELVEKQLDSRIESHKKQLRVNTQEICNKINQLVESNDVIEKLIGLLLASGSRPNELFEKANYVPLNDKCVANSLGPYWENWITQDYIAKNSKKESVTKPLIELSAEEFIDELATARQMLRDKYKVIMKDGQVSSTISGHCNKMMKAIFENESISCYASRKIYAMVSYKLYSKETERFGEDPTFNWWINNVCAHGERNLGVSLYYNSISLDD